MNSFVLKMIGIVTMLCDHIGKVFLTEEVWLQCVGRLAYPIFAFGVAQGYLHTRNVKKYAVRLGIFAVASQVPYTLFMIAGDGDPNRLNVIFTLLLGLMAVYLCDRVSQKWLGVGLALVLCAAAELLKVDYGAYGVGTVVLMYWYSKMTSGAEVGARQRVSWTVLTTVVFAAMTVLKYLEPLIMQPEDAWFFALMILWTVVGLVPIMLYNGRLGVKCKYLFYVFYPVHLAVIYVVWAMAG